MDVDKVVRALSGGVWLGGFLPEDGSTAVAIHRCFQREAWREAPLRDRLAMCAALPLAPIAMLALSAVFTSLNAKAVKTKTGKGIVRQFCEQIRVASRFAIPAPWYYIFELHDDARRRIARDFINRWEMKSGLYRFLRDYNGGLPCPAKRSTTCLADKARFAERCRAFGLATAPVYLVVAEGGQVHPVDWREPGLPGADLFVKPAHGRGGRNAARWSYQADCGKFRGSAGDLATAAELLERLRRAARRRAFLVQPRLVNHPLIADLAGGALATVRIMSCRNEKGDCEVTNAVLRMARHRDAVVDNFHAGGIAARVDLGTGELGEATGGAWGSTGGGWFERHPETGARIAGRRIPSWNETLDLVRFAHRGAFADQVVIGWDVAVLPDGPCLIEANKAPDLDIVQRVGGGPVGNDRLGTLLAFNLRRAAAAKYA